VHLHLLLLCFQVILLAALFCHQCCGLDLGGGLRLPDSLEFTLGLLLEKVSLSWLVAFLVCVRQCRLDRSGGFCFLGGLVLTFRLVLGNVLLVICCLW